MRGLRGIVLALAIGVVALAGTACSNSDPYYQQNAPNDVAAANAFLAHTGNSDIKAVGQNLSRGVVLETSDDTEVAAKILITTWSMTVQKLDGSNVICTSGSAADANVLNAKVAAGDYIAFDAANYATPSNVTVLQKGAVSITGH